MLVKRIVCPKCKSTLASKTGVEAGTPIACPKCKQKFKVTPEPVVEIDEPDEDEAPRKKPAKRRGDDENELPRKKSSKGRDDDEDDDEKPAPKRRARAIDDDDRPKSKKRKREDDEDDEDDSEDDDRPRRKKSRNRRDELSAYAKLKSNIWVRVGVMAVLLIILGIVGYLYNKKLNDEQKSPFAPDNSINTKADK